MEKFSAPKDSNELVLHLISEIQADLLHPFTQTSCAVRRVSRLARLRNDFVNLFWIEFEMIGATDKLASVELRTEIEQHLGKEQTDKLHLYFGESWIARRTGPLTAEEAGNAKNAKTILAGTVAQLEAKLAYFIDERDRITAELAAPHVATVHLRNDLFDAKRIVLSAIHDYQVVLGRINQQVGIYVGCVEQELRFSSRARDVFTFYQRTVDAQLGRLDATALAKLNAAVDRLIDGNAEARSHALTSCRRVLATLADVLYPPVDAPTKCSDGQVRDLGKDKYKNRLVEYVSKTMKNGVSRKLLIQTIEDTDKRISLLNELASKGVHAEVSLHEVNQCVIQVYLCIGDVLSLTQADAS